MPESKLVVFKVAGQSFAADISEVQEVIRTPDVTPLPHPSPPILGVFNLRGHIVTALDGHAALGFVSAAATSGRTVVFSAKGRTLGLLVQDASKVIAIDADAVRPAPDEQISRAARGIVIHDGDPIVLIDIRNLLTSPRSTAQRPQP